jgi:hypothetical protein
MAAKLKMATKTKFTYVAKKTLVRLRTFGVFIDFGLEENKKNIWKLQNQKWMLNSRWSPKFDLLLKSTNHLFYQKFLVCLIGCPKT